MKSKGFIGVSHIKRNIACYKLECVIMLAIKFATTSKKKKSNRKLAVEI